MCAGKHLRHVAEQVGEKLPVRKGWLGRQKLLWKLPDPLRFLAEVESPALRSSSAHDQL